jgi:phosphohistidine phosphatase
MRLYLVRHGDAKAEAVDPARPLSDRGWAEVARMARHLGALRLPVAEIRHSEKLRAVQTADALARSLAPPYGLRPARGLNPLDDPAIAREDVEVFPEPLMLVGHLPHLGRLAQALLGIEREVFDFPPAAAVALLRSDRGWRLDWVLTPEIVPEST